MEWYQPCANTAKPRWRRRVGRLAKLFRNPGDVWLMMRIAGWAAILPVLKRIVPLKVLTKFMWVSAGSSGGVEQEQKIAVLVRWLYTFVFPNERSCLSRSLLLYRFLSRNNTNPLLVTGIRRTEDENWKGHAWVLVDGKPFEAEPRIEDFQTLMVFGTGGTMNEINHESR